VAVGETQKRSFQLSFNSCLKVDFQGARVTSDGGLILLRERDERLGLGALMERHLTDWCRGGISRFSAAMPPVSNCCSPTLHDVAPVEQRVGDEIH